jgi:hypothetical protein
MDICRLAYITSGNLWRSGGYLVSLNRGEQTNEFEYILFKSFGNGIYSVQLCDIKQLYIKEKKKKKIEGVLYKTPIKITKYPVILQDKNGRDIIVKYSRNGYAYNKFINTKKYKRSKEIGWFFENGTQKPDIIFSDDESNEESDEEIEDSNSEYSDEDE